MNIVVAVRCYNESKNIERFMRGYDFADTIVVSDGGSTDDSVSILEKYPKVRLLHFNQQETMNGETWNPDAPHMNFVLDAAKELKPDWLIFDDMDCVPNFQLRHFVRTWLSGCSHPQMNAFRLYLWGEDKFFPFMNRNFDMDYTSLWAWKPSELDIHADVNLRHGTLVGLSEDVHKLPVPYVLLHKSWHPADHPLSFAGTPEPLPYWAIE